MRLDELLRNLTMLARSHRTDDWQTGPDDVSLDELHQLEAVPEVLTLAGSGQVIVSLGDHLLIETEAPSMWRIGWSEGTLSLSSERGAPMLRITAPPLRKIAVAGSGRIACEQMARDAEISVKGSGRLEVASLVGGDVAVSVAGSGRVAVDGRGESLALSIAGSGSCDAEGLRVEEVVVNIAGSGDAIVNCDGEVTAHLIGSGNVIVIGSARCQVRSVGSGRVICERAPAAA